MGKFVIIIVIVLIALLLAVYVNHRIRLEKESELGITRLMPKISESDAIKNGTLTETEKEIYRAVFYNRTATVTMIDETAVVKEMQKSCRYGSTTVANVAIYFRWFGRNRF